MDKVKLDVTLAARAADWVLRRAIFDSGRILGAAGAAFYPPVLVLEMPRGIRNTADMESYCSADALPS